MTPCMSTAWLEPGFESMSAPARNCPRSTATRYLPLQVRVVSCKYVWAGGTIMDNPKSAQLQSPKISLLHLCTPYEYRRHPVHPVHPVHLSQFIKGSAPGIVVCLH